MRKPRRTTEEKNRIRELADSLNWDWTVFRTRVIETFVQWGKAIPSDNSIRAWYYCHEVATGDNKFVIEKLFGEKLYGRQ